MDADELRAREGGAAAEREGALVDVAHAPWDALPYEDGSFDIALVRDLLPALAPDTRKRCLVEVLRVLRPADASSSSKRPAGGSARCSPAAVTMRSMRRGAGRPPRSRRAASPASGSSPSARARVLVEGARRA